MSEVQTPLNSAISLAHKTAQIAQPPTRIPSISKVHPVRKYGRGFKPLPNYNKVSSPPLRMGHLSNRVKVSRDTSGKITVAFPYDPSRISRPQPTENKGLSASLEAISKAFYMDRKTKLRILCGSI